MSQLMLQRVDLLILAIEQALILMNHVLQIIAASAHFNLTLFDDASREFIQKSKQILGSNNYAFPTSERLYRQHSVFDLRQELLDRSNFVNYVEMIELVLVVQCCCELLVHINQHFQTLAIHLKSVSECSGLTLDHPLGCENHVVLDFSLVHINFTGTIVKFKEQGVYLVSSEIELP